MEHSKHSCSQTLTTQRPETAGELGEVGEEGGVCCQTHTCTGPANSLLLSGIAHCKLRDDSFSKSRLELHRWLQTQVISSTIHRAPCNHAHTPQHTHAAKLFSRFSFQRRVLRGQSMSPFPRHVPKGSLVSTAAETEVNDMRASDRPPQAQQLSCHLRLPILGLNQCNSRSVCRVTAMSLAILPVIQAVLVGPGSSTDFL